MFIGDVDENESQGESQEYDVQESDAQEDGEGDGSDAGADGGGDDLDEGEEKDGQERNEELLDEDGEDSTPPAAEEFEIPDLDDDPAAEVGSIDPVEALAEAQRAAVLQRLEAKRAPTVADPILTRKDQLLKEHAEAAHAGNPSDVRQLLDALGFDENIHHAYEGTVSAFVQQLCRVMEVNIADQYEKKEVERAKQAKEAERAAAEKAVKDRFRQSLEALPEDKRTACGKVAPYLAKALGGEQFLTELQKRSGNPAMLMLALSRPGGAASLERLADAAGDPGDFVERIKDLDEKMKIVKQVSPAKSKPNFKADQRIPHNASSQASVENKKRAIESLKNKISSTNDVVKQAELASKLADLMG